MNAETRLNFVKNWPGIEKVHPLRDSAEVKRILDAMFQSGLYKCVHNGGYYTATINLIYKAKNQKPMKSNYVVRKGNMR